jgi:hypothetical protein
LEMNRRDNGGTGTTGFHNTSSSSYYSRSITYPSTPVTLQKR